jgi:hypothetical protein
MFFKTGMITIDQFVCFDFTISGTLSKAPFPTFFCCHHDLFSLEMTRGIVAAIIFCSHGLTETLAHSEDALISNVFYLNFWLRVVWGASHDEERALKCEVKCIAVHAVCTHVSGTCKNQQAIA